MAMRIGELAGKTGCKVVTIRYYEKEGLLSKPERSGANYRVYREEDLERLEFIIYCRRHGMSLGEIKKLLAFRDAPQADCSWIAGMVESHIANVDEQIRSLEHLKEHLQQLRNKCDGGSEGSPCGIILSLGKQDLYCSACKRAQIIGSETIGAKGGADNPGAE